MTVPVNSDPEAHEIHEELGLHGLTDFRTAIFYILHPNFYLYPFLKTSNIIVHFFNLSFKIQSFSQDSSSFCISNVFGSQQTLKSRCLTLKFSFPLINFPLPGNSIFIFPTILTWKSRHWPSHLLLSQLPASC